MTRSPFLLVLVFDVLGGLQACTGARVPYRYGSVRTRPGPVHQVRVALLPLVDTRLEAEKGGGERFVYRGLEYIGTRLEALPPPPMFEVTEVLARHLARTRVFAQIVLVRDARQGRAEGADLILTGAVYRLRGYVEATPTKAGGRPLEERRVLAEVEFRNLTLQNLRGDVVMEADTGWAISETRPLEADGTEPDPWQVLAEAMQVALTRWTDEIAQADLSGRVLVRERVRLEAGTATVTPHRAFGRLPKEPPEGWQFVETSSAARPVGWRGQNRCREAHLGWVQTIRFHRVLGPYQPRVRLWVCPENQPFEFDGRVDFPARLLGRTAGHWYFSLMLGQSNWPGAESQIARHLGLEVPRKYLFRVGDG